MTKILPISEVKAHLPKLVRGVEQREDEVIVTRNGRPAARLVSYSEYERLKETLDVLSDADLMKQIRQSLKEIAAGKPALSFEDVFGEPLEPRRKKRRR
jgi:antitoxin YefM